MGLSGQHQIEILQSFLYLELEDHCWIRSLGVTLETRESRRYLLFVGFFFLSFSSYLNVLSVSTVVPNQAFLTTIDSLSKDKGDWILMYYCSITKAMKIIHSVENIGNTSWFNAPLIVAQDGFAKSKSTPVLLDLDSLLNGKEIDVPSQANILAVTSKDEFLALDVSTRGGRMKMNSFPFMLLPPLLWDTIILLVDCSPARVFEAFLARIESFIAENKENKKLNSIEKQNFVLIFQFLWANSKLLWDSICIIPSGDDSMVESWSMCRHNMCICLTPTQTSQVDPDANLAKISEAIEAFQNALSSKISASSDEITKKKGFSKLDSSVKNMILNASASDPEIAPGAPCKSCEDFFKQSSRGSARLSFI